MVSKVECFDYLWERFRDQYGIFDAKRVDWEGLNRLYRPRAKRAVTDDDLYGVLTGMLSHLNDNHVKLKSGNRLFIAGSLRGSVMDDFSRELIISKYLKTDHIGQAGSQFIYGSLKGNLGYMQFNRFAGLTETSTVLNKIKSKFKNMAGVVVDVRANKGGDDRAGKLIAGAFADKKRPYMITRTRSANGGFAKPRLWQVEPSEKAITCPAALLIHGHSVSAAENFTLAMRALPHVTLIGSTTSGCFADRKWDTLPNGWRVTISYKHFTDQNGFCWEGLGIPPDIWQTNTKREIETGHDKVLELAIDWLTKKGD